MNLFICFTPLQMLIAERIIDKKELEDNLLIVVSYTDNDKFRYYYNKLGKKCNWSYFFLINEKNIITRFLSVIKLKRIIYSLPIKRFNDCYLASIDSSYVQLITSNVKFNHLYTFDDGTNNIVKNGMYYSNKNYFLLDKIFRKIFNIKHTMQFYKSNSLTHYTIFDNKNNITEKIELIKLFDGEFEVHKRGNKLVKIFIGQPLNEINIKKETLISLLNKENINYYFPHPREKEVFLNVEYIYTNKIFEDFLVEYLKRNLDVDIEIYTFFSGVILNVKDINRVNTYAIYHKDIADLGMPVYDVFKENNIKIKENF